MLTRTLYDSAPARTMLPFEMRVDLGETTSAIMDRPELGGLALQSRSEARAREGAFTNEQNSEIRRLKLDYLSRSNDLFGEIFNANDDLDRAQPRAQLEVLKRDLETDLLSIEADSIAAGRLVSIDDLKVEYGDLIEFDRAMPRAEAEMLYDNRKAEVIRQAIIERGPDGFVATAAQFGAGLLNVATDPLEIATAFIPVVGPLSKLRLVSKFGRVGGRTVQGSIEGFVGNLVTEPVYYALSRQQQLDYTMNDALLNVGLGLFLGAGLGAGAGVLSRIRKGRYVAPDITPISSLERDMANVALRQALNGQPINLARLLDGTDLRGTTALSRADGIVFQSRPVVPLPIVAAESIRPTTLVGGDRFLSPDKARVAAEKIGGRVMQSEPGFVIRRPTEGDFIRDPRGQPLTFKTKRAADKFRAAVRDPGGKTSTIPIGPRQFAIGRDMTKADIEAISRGQDSLEIPDGVNTRETAILPDAKLRMDQAVRGTMAYRQVSRQLARDNAPDVVVKTEIDAPTADEADMQGQVDNLAASIRQLDDLTPEQKIALDDIAKIETRAAAEADGIRAYAACLT